ncbi:Uncharacterised protein [Candidatus Norongarragalina meridionalis]|nr:Uncharacterised protein [Candidatus Norongarragalina meridionalis]
MRIDVSRLCYGEITRAFEGVRLEGLARLGDKVFLECG